MHLGDAFIGAGSSTIDDFAGVTAALRRELDVQGRDPTDFSIAKRMYLMVDDDPARARERVDAIYGRRESNEDIAIWVTPEQVADAVRRVGGAGAGLVVLNPVGHNADDDREQMERLAAEVIPQVA